jgi:hypothetical protein
MNCIEAGYIVRFVISQFLNGKNYSVSIYGRPVLRIATFGRGKAQFTYNNFN